MDEQPFPELASVVTGRRPTMNRSEAEIGEAKKRRAKLGTQRRPGYADAIQQAPKVATQPCAIAPRRSVLQWARWCGALSELIRDDRIPRASLVPRFALGFLISFLRNFAAENLWVISSQQRRECYSNCEAVH
jgi:hypothetical protein